MTSEALRQYNTEYKLPENEDEYQAQVDGLIAEINQSANNPERFPHLERKLVMLELERQRQEQSEIVLSPRLRLMALQYRDLIETQIELGKAGGSFIFYGLPGNGKSQLSEYIARSVRNAYGVVHINSSITNRFEDQIVISENKLKTILAQDQVTQPTPEDVIENVIALSVWTNAGSPEQLRRSWSRFVGQFQEATDIEVTSNIKGTESPEELTTIIVNTSTNENRGKIIDFFSSKLKRCRLLGPVGLAIENGFLVFADEIDKEHLNNVISAGAGSEAVLATKTNRTLIHSGTAMRVTSGYMVLATANSVGDISEHITRPGRLETRHFSLEVEDFFFTARVMLSDANGIYLFESKPDIDAKLSRFLLWFKAFSNIPHGVQMNVLTDMCQFLKRGKSFEWTIAQVITNETLETYHTYMTKSNGEASITLKEFTFRALASASLEKNLSLTPFQTIYPDPSSESLVVANNYGNKQQIMERHIGRADVEVLASSPYCQRAITKDSRNNILCFDMPTGKEVKLSHVVKKAEGFKNPYDMSAVFITDNRGVLYSMFENKLHVYPFEIIPSDRSTENPVQANQQDNESGYIMRVLPETRYDVDVRERVVVQDNLIQCGALKLRINNSTLFKTTPLTRLS
jgi:hypothetical protein